MTPTTRTAPNPDGRGIREEILMAGLAIMREEGIQALTQVQVARRANVRQSHVTYYFPKRQDLIAGVAGRCIEDIAHTGANAAAHAPEGDLGTSLRRVMSAIGDEGHMRMFIGLIVEADADPELRQLLVRLTREVQQSLATLIGGDHAMERAALVLASMWGLGMFDFVMRPKRRRTSLAAHLARIAGASERGKTRRGRR
jgi:AcrR family transcriptional regulator